MSWERRELLNSLRLVHRLGELDVFEQPCALPRFVALAPTRRQPRARARANARAQAFRLLAGQGARDADCGGVPRDLLLRLHLASRRPRSAQIL